MDRRPAALLTAALALMALVGLPAPPVVSRAPAVPAVIDVGAELLPREPAAERRSCKPSAPVALQFAQYGAGPGGQRSLAFSVHPRQELAGLSWSLELGDGATLLAGEPTGEADPRLGARTSGQLSVALPAGASFAEVVLRAQGQGADGEQVVVERALTWGATPPVAPVQRLLDTTTGAARRMALLPTVHEPGR